MTYTVTELANDSKVILDRVIQNHEPVDIQRHGRTVVEIHPAPGVSRQELLRMLKDAQFTQAESRELQKAMDAASEVVGYAGGN